MTTRTLIRPTGFVDSPFGHDGKVARLAGGLNWFGLVELIQFDGNKRLSAEIVRVRKSRALKKVVDRVNELKRSRR